MVFILLFGAGISCWGNFSITTSGSAWRTAGVLDLCWGGGGAGTGGGILGGEGMHGGGGGGGGKAGPKNERI